jgi:hypothetical protein
MKLHIWENVEICFGIFFFIFFQNYSFEFISSIKDSQCFKTNSTYQIIPDLIIMIMDQGSSSK